MTLIRKTLVAESLEIKQYAEKDLNDISLYRKFF